MYASTDSSSIEFLTRRVPNYCQHISPYRFLNGFPDLSQFAGAKLTHYSSKSQRPSDSLRPRLRLLQALLQSIHVWCVFTMSWGELFVQALFWLGAFKTQQSNDELRTGRAPLALPHHSTNPPPLPPFNSNASCRWESLHHHAFLCK